MLDPPLPAARGASPTRGGEPPAICGPATVGLPRITGRADASPVWVAFLDGRVVNIRHGQLSDAEIGELIDHLSPTEL